MIMTSLIGMLKSGNTDGWNRILSRRGTQKILFQNLLLERQTLLGFDLTKVQFINCRFGFCEFEDFCIANSCFVNCNFRWVNFWEPNGPNLQILGSWFEDCKFVGGNLPAANFQNSKAVSVTFEEQKLFRLRWSGGQLRSSLFLKCNLRYAIFEQTVFRGTGFESTDLSGAEFGPGMISSRHISNCNIAGTKVQFGHSSPASTQISLPFI